MQVEPPTAAAAAEADAPVDSAAQRAPAPRRPRRRWRKWLILALVLLAVRLLLPGVVAPMLAARLSRALGTRVEIGDVSFQPIDAIFTLRRVTVHAPAGSTESAPIVARRVRADMQWLPLMHQKLELREIALESARVDLDRLADGTFSLANLERSNPAAELPEGWSFALNRITVRDSQLRVRDLGAGGDGMLEATLRSASVSGIRRRATAFGKAPNLFVDALVGGGQLRVRGRYELRDDGLVLDAQMRVKNIPLAQAKPYVANLGWSDVAGQVSGQLRWQREPRRRDLLTGRAVLRRASAHVSGLTDPALTIRRAIAEISAFDFVTRRMVIRSLALRGTTLALRPDASAPLPLLTTAVAPTASVRGRDTARTATQSAGRWHWMIERFDTADGRIRVLAADGPFDLRAQASGENLGPGAYWSPLRVHARRHAVVAAFDGSARLGEGVVVEGRLTAGGIDVPGLARAAAIPWADLVQSGTATADLTVQLDAAMTDSYVRGGITLTDVWVAGSDPNLFAFGSSAIDLTLDRYEPREEAELGGRGGRPARIVFSNANVNAPYVLLTRADDGWYLPPFTVAIGEHDDPAEQGAAPVPTTVPQTEIDPTAIAEVTFQSVRTNDGSVTIVDLVPPGTVDWTVTRVRGSATRLVLPFFSFDNLQLHGSDYRFGQLYLGGSRRPGGYHLDAAGTGVPLAALTPYLRLSGLPYSFASGKADFSARGLITAGRWNANAAVTLQDANVLGMDALQMSLGMPVSSALAVLRDESGATTLQLALSSPPLPGQGTLADQVAAGIRSTMRTVTETAAAARERDRLPIVNVLFAPGQALLSAAAMQEIDPVADLLADRPGLLVEISAETSQKDRRWLAEQALLPSLEDSGGGFRGVLRALGVEDARLRIRAAIAARARGALGLLSADDEAALSRMIAEAPPVSDQQLAGLREVRMMRVVNHLAEHYDLLAPRVVVRRGPSSDESQSAVRLQVAIAPEPPQPSPSPSPAAEQVGGGTVP